jgi:hypothetical protein
VEAAVDYGFTIDASLRSFQKMYETARAMA